MASTIRPTLENATPVKSTSPEKAQKTSASGATDSNDGNESGDSVEIVEPSNPEVINVDDSDREELDVSRESHATGTQTLHQQEER